MNRDQGTFTRPVMRFDGWWSFVIVASLLVGRWNAISDPLQLNPDEGIVIAGAMTLRHDPLFWRSVFGLTTGPLDFYALLPIGSLFGDTFFAARLTGTLLLAASLMFVHATLAVSYGRGIARLSTVSPICFEALSTGADFLHYSTELVPIFLLSAATYFGLPLINGSSGSRRRGLLVGGVLGAVPYAKLQAGPIALGLGLGLVVILWAHCRSPSNLPSRIVYLIGGALMPTLVFGAMLAVTPDKKGALVSFLSANVAYTGRGDALWPLFRALGWRVTGNGLLLAPWLIGSLLTILGIILLSFSNKSKSQDPMIGIAGLAVILSVACILIPGRAFPHYAQLLVIPVTLLSGAIAGAGHARLRSSGQPRRAHIVRGAILLPTALMLGDFAAAQRFNIFAGSEPNLDPVSDVSKVARKYLKRGEPLAVWGLPGHYYVELGARQAARHATTEAEIMQNPYLRLFRSRYLADIQNSVPPVFIDASYLPSLFPVRGIAHDISFREFGEFIRANYTLVQTVDEARIFVRNDRAPGSK